MIEYADNRRLQTPAARKRKRLHEVTHPSKPTRAATTTRARASFAPAAPAPMSPLVRQAMRLIKLAETEGRNPEADPALIRLYQNSQIRQGVARIIASRQHLRGK